MTHRLPPAQLRRQWIFSTLFLAGAGYLLYLVLRGPMTDRTTLVAGLCIPMLTIGGIAQLNAVFTSVSFDQRELWWTGLLGFRKRFAWADVTNVEVVKKSDRANAPEIVRVTHRVRGAYDLPVLFGLPGSWRDPAFEAKAAHLIATWRAASAAVTADGRS
ncbi:hypothetical protein KV557_34725 [Kitasatospora aureofaciens]|uniref:hypothetical protein n=1 Tax=Kitasatospora aureofaciens TaxID=1894 RepID=UPI001C461E40|nr:hypothetical protein [Kitasatospora aureofaciens]MBV6702203.1 hypothetical protein [Kitasatospora aureofaciens]